MFALISLSIFSYFFWSVLAAPTQAPLFKAWGYKRENSHIVKLKDGVRKTDIVRWLGSHVGKDDWAMTLGYDYSPGFFNGFSGNFPPRILDILATSPHVQYISEDSILTAYGVQTDAPWGLHRISEHKRIDSGSPYALNYTYNYDDKAGEGVDVFVLDTGIYIGHSEFEGRASWGWSAFDGTPDDGNGHGTHCAGIIAGRVLGVAKKVNVIAVKVLSDSGSGSSSQAIAGLNYVVKRCEGSSRPCVISMSFGGELDIAVDEGVNAAISAGIHVIVSAGNDGIDAKDISPARAQNVITVGASSIDDIVAPFSNFGPVVDIFAPGVDIASSWIGSPDAVKLSNGTSMAAPYVTGIAASLLSVYGQHTPADLAARIKGLAAEGILVDVPLSTINSLAQLD